MSETEKLFSSFTTTRIGTINRDIEKNIKLVVLGCCGATGEAISSAKKRQALLAARPFKAKQPVKLMCGKARATLAELEGMK